MSSPNRSRKLREFVRTYSRSKAALFGLSFLIVLISAAVAAGFIFPGDPEQPNLPKTLLAPALTDPFGTDYLGRDQLVLIIYGARSSLIVAFAAGSILSLLGTMTGLLAGYFGGRIDGIIMRIADIFLTIPVLPLVLLVIAIMGTTLNNVMLMIGLTGWPIMARIVRADTLSLMKREFVEMEKVMGASPFRILFRHLLPNQLSSILVYTSLSVPSVILTEAGIEFLGLAPLSISWGFMLNTSLSYWISGAWWLSFFPGLAIFSTALAFYFVSEGLKEALNPKLRRKRESLYAQLRVHKR
jgi:ABC-type dipeptide/oligopeptide/nickel transport system permease subunit